MHKRQGTPLDLFVIENLINKFVRSNMKMMQSQMKRELIKSQNAYNPSIRRRILTPKKEEQAVSKKVLHKPQGGRPKSESVGKKQYSTINLNEQNSNHLRLNAKANYLQSIKDKLQATKSQRTLKEEIGKWKSNQQSNPLVINNFNKPARIHPVRPSLKTLPSSFPIYKKTFPSQPNLEQRFPTELSGWHTKDDVDWD